MDQAYGYILLYRRQRYIDEEEIRWLKGDVVNADTSSVPDATLRWIIDAAQWCFTDLFPTLGDNYDFPCVDWVDYFQTKCEEELENRYDVY